MKKTLVLLLVTVTALVLGGCTILATTGQRLVSETDQYCTTRDPFEAALLLAAIRAYVPDYNSICRERAGLEPAATEEELKNMSDDTLDPLG